MFSAEIVQLIATAAEGAGIEPAALLALVEVETGGRIHAIVRGRQEPLIRFEGHYFDRRLSPPEREQAHRLGLAATSAGKVRNPSGQAARWRMLEQAAEINRRAAYESTSWGMGQVMGAHWAWLGYPSVDALADEARSGPRGQLELMLRYITKAGLLEPLRRREWSTFARGYNGPGFARNSYHLKLSLAYRRHTRRLAGTALPEGPTRKAMPGILHIGDRGEAVRHLQTMLCALGHPLTVDGAFGLLTREAVRSFQGRHGLAVDGIAGAATMAAMEKALPLGRAAAAWPWLAALMRRLLPGRRP